MSDEEARALAMLRISINGATDGGSLCHSSDRRVRSRNRKEGFDGLTEHEDNESRGTQEIVAAE